MYLTKKEIELLEYVERLKESLRTTIELYDEMNDRDYYKPSTKRYIDDLKTQLDYFEKTDNLRYSRLKNKNQPK
jgi:hypothetical protein